MNLVEKAEFIVLIRQLLNSAIEADIDRIGHERLKLSVRAKDIALTPFHVITTFCNDMADKMSNDGIKLQEVTTTGCLQGHPTAESFYR
ncbi:diacylglycerol kinase [Veronia nyctiphanis]|uniref:diacylglycerol kinase n=1 Tax=Veronia nyctiphanis TaxID=1278244 RepID=UPI00100C08CC